MKPICRTALPVLAAVALVAFAARGGGNKTASLQQQLLGTWTMVANVLDPGGTKSEPFRPGAKGNVIFTSNGRVAVVIPRAGVPQFASNNPATRSAEREQA